MRRQVLRLCGALFFLSCWTARAAINESELKERYREAVGGNKAAVAEVIAQLEQVLTSQPQNQLARVYLGSAYTLRSRDLGFGPMKLSALRHGLALMDEAVSAAPDEGKVRLARALTTSALPSFFGRAAESRQDFELLAERARRELEKFAEGDLQIVFYNAGLAAQTAGNSSRARELWRTALQHPADPALKRKTEAELTRLK